MANKTWKNTERKVAAFLGGERVPITGRQRGDQPDIRHSIFSLEVKHKKQLPEWLHDAIRQAVASLKTDQQLPVVILHEKGQRHTQDYAVIRLADLRDWFGLDVNSAVEPVE